MKRKMKKKIKQINRKQKILKGNMKLTQKVRETTMKINNKF